MPAECIRLSQSYLLKALLKDDEKIITLAEKVERDAAALISECRRAVREGSRAIDDLLVIFAKKGQYSSIDNLRKAQSALEHFEARQCGYYSSVKYKADSLRAWEELGLSPEQEVVASMTESTELAIRVFARVNYDNIYQWANKGAIETLDELQNKSPLITSLTEFTRSEEIGYLGCADIAKKYAVPKEALAKRLARFRKQHTAGTGWREDDPSSRQVRGPRYLYSLSEVKSIVDDLRRTVALRNRRPASLERLSKKILHDKSP